MKSNNQFIGLRRNLPRGARRGSDTTVAVDMNPNSIW
jgi:hypothetical protein